MPTKEREKTKYLQGFRMKLSRGGLWTNDEIRKDGDSFAQV